MAEKFVLKDIDRRILHELDKNSRISFAQLGKKVHLSKNAVAQRVKKLQKEKILQSFYPVIDFSKVGLYYCTVEVKLESADVAKEKEMLKYIDSVKGVSWAGFQHGEYQFVFVLLVPSLHDAHTIIKGFSSEFSKYILDKRFSVMSKLHHFKHKFLNPEYHEEVISGGHIAKSIDEVDEKILGLLAKNSRTPLFEIANKLGISAKTAAKRIDAMIDKKVILEFKIKLNFTMLGYQHYHIFLDLKGIVPEKEKEMINYLKAQPETFFIDEVLGRGDLDFDLYLSSDRELHDFMTRMKQRFHSLIRNYSFAVVYSVHEEKYY